MRHRRPNFASPAARCFEEIAGQPAAALEPPAAPLAPAAPGPITLEGYALVWGDTSSDRGGYRVRLMRDCAALQEDALALFHHDARYILGSRHAGTFRTAADDYGIRVEIDLPPTSYARDLAALVERGDIRGMSFKMKGRPKGRLVSEAGAQIFEAHAFAVEEVTVTGTPAFRRSNIRVKRAGLSPLRPEFTAASIADHRRALDGLAAAFIRLTTSPHH